MEMFKHRFKASIFCTYLSSDNLNDKVVPSFKAEIDFINKTKCLIIKEINKRIGYL